MHIIVVGLNHRSAPVELRERLAFSQERLPNVFSQLRKQVGHFIHIHLADQIQKHLLVQ